MPLPAFLLEAVLISLTGVMSPGPITAVTIGKGSDSPHAGAIVAAGHGIVEFPLMIAIYYGFGQLLNLFYVKAAIGLVGGLFLLYMGISMFRSIKTADFSSGKYTQSPITAGVLLSLGNPYFLVWWATIGFTLILRSVRFGITGFILFALVHWLCDFIWCYFLSTASYKGGRFLGKTFQRIVFSVCGVFLLFFSGKFIFEGIRIFFT